METTVETNVKTFINNLHAGLIEIDPKAQNIFFKHGVEGKESLSNILGSMISDYQTGKENPNNPYYPKADNVLEWINKAYTNGVVKESKSLLTELSKKDDIIQNQKEEMKTLKQNIQKLATDYTRLQGSYQELEKRLDRMIPNKDVKK